MSKHRLSTQALVGTYATVGAVSGAAVDYLTSFHAVTAVGVAGAAGAWGYSKIPMLNLLIQEEPNQFVYPALGACGGLAYWIIKDKIF